MDSSVWRTEPFSWDVAQRLAEELELPLVVGIVLASRGFADPAEARAFLEVDPAVPDPFLFGHMEEAVHLIDHAVDRRRRVVVHGDYDVDGISATALMVLGLRDLGLEPEYYLPSRFVEGYGLSREAVEAVAGGGDALLITVDCGVNYPEEVALARSLGLDVIVTDHHRPGELLPNCPVVHHGVGDYPGSHLCGVGVALKLLHGLHVHRHGASRSAVPEPLLHGLDLVALGTIADLVPLVGENRYYVKEGIVRLNWGGRPGLRALMRAAACEGAVDASAVGFRLAPRLNAAGRLQDPLMPLRLLLTEDEEEAGRLAEELDQLNRQRRDVEAKILEQALGRVEALDELPAALVLAAEGWHEGVIGIVASRLVERYHRPTVLLAVRDGVARGSGRSIPAYDLMSGLRSCAGMLTVYGGHHQAAGLTLPTAHVSAVADALASHAAARLEPADLRRVYAADAVVRGQELALDTVDALESLAPFGAGNPPVRLLALGARVDDPALTRTGDHLKATLVLDGVCTRGIGFGLGTALEHLQQDQRVHAGLSLGASAWQGYERTEVQFVTLYKHEDRGEAELGCSPTCTFRDALDALPPCERCSDPYNSPTVPLPLRGRDIRDQGGYLSAIAQVVSSGEPTVILGPTVSGPLRAVAGTLPLTRLGVAAVDCVSRLCWRTQLEALREFALLFVDWTAAERRPDLFVGKRHVVVAGPPFRASHTHLLADLRDRGLTIHLCYGAEERQSCAHLLRFQVHPRYWMTALYRVWRNGLEGEQGLEAVVQAGWDSHGVLPAAEDLSLAASILSELGYGPGRLVGAKIGVEDVLAYRAAEAAYKEALRLCRSA